MGTFLAKQIINILVSPTYTSPTTVSMLVGLIQSRTSQASKAIASNLGKWAVPMFLFLFILLLFFKMAVGGVIVTPAHE